MREAITAMSDLKAMQDSTHGQEIPGAKEALQALLDKANSCIVNLVVKLREQKTQLEVVFPDVSVVKTAMEELPTLDAP